MTKTPEGFLVCHSVPICRTGMQEYTKQELGVKDRDGFLKVYREEREVFKPSAIASFEGKPVTDDHPPVGVDASNYASYTKGTVQNVRRGSGEDRDKLICDLVVYDAALIAKIDAGKREISCGYECKYIEMDDGTYCQTDIIGNHVAVVEEGRAGHEVAIRDAKAKPEGGKQMAKKGSILHRMFAVFVKDAEPEEVREAARAVDEAEGGGTAPEDVQETQDKDVAALMDAVAALNAKMDAFTKQQVQDDDPDGEPDEKSEETEALDELEEELKEGDPEPTEDDESEEESVTVPPEKLEDEEPEEVPVDDPQPAPTADRALALSVIRTMKPFIAAMPAGQQRRAADALSRTLKKAMRTKDTQPLAGGYAALARRKTADAARLAQSMRAFGENCRKRNPHCKKEEK